MLSFETKVWFTTLLPETLAFSAATTNLSFSPSFCHPTNPLSISPVISLLHFLSIAPHYFAHSLSPRSSLWCLLLFLSFTAAKLWLSLKSDTHLMFNGHFLLIFFLKCRGMCMWMSVCVCVFAHLCHCVCLSAGVTEGPASRRGRQEEEEVKASSFKQSVSMFVFICGTRILGQADNISTWPWPQGASMLCHQFRLIWRQKRWKDKEIKNSTS